MLHSIWGTTWAGMWVHLDPEEQELSSASIRALLVLGILPSLLAAWGLGLAVRRVVRDPDATVEATLVALSAVALAAFAIFAYRVPTFAALKAMYLLSLSPAWALFVVLALSAITNPAVRRVAGGLALAPLALAVVVYPSWSRPSEPENVGMARVHDHFGDLDAARGIYRRELARSLAAEAGAPRLNPFWLREMLAAVELEAGRFDAARDLYRESLSLRSAGTGSSSMGANSPFVRNRLAVAEALAGSAESARERLDRVIVDEPYPEFLASRAALRAQAGDLAGAQRDLREALASEPGLASALETRAWLAGDRDGVAAARRAAARAPRAYPYGVGDGRGLNTQLPMLVWREDALALYRPARSRP
jgi:tetratricopeptide (TPR) repeat protein